MSESTSYNREKPATLVALASNYRNVRAVIDNDVVDFYDANDEPLMSLSPYQALEQALTILNIDSDSA